MRIETIEIQNFRQYRKEKFEFPKIKGKKDIHVIAICLLNFQVLKGRMTCILSMPRMV